MGKKSVTITNGRYKKNYLKSDMRPHTIMEHLVKISRVEFPTLPMIFAHNYSIAVKEFVFDLLFGLKLCDFTKRNKSWLNLNPNHFLIWIV